MRMLQVILLYFSGGVADVPFSHSQGLLGRIPYHNDTHTRITALFLGLPR